MTVLQSKQGFRVSIYTPELDCLKANSLLHARVCERCEGAGERNENKGEPSPSPSTPLVFIVVVRSFASLAEPGTG